METKTTFSFKNMTDKNSSVALWAFGFAEGLVTIVQSAEWFYDYQWAVRLLPILAFSLSQFKLLFKTEVVGGVKQTSIVTDADAEVIVETETPKTP